ncbi:hypothetical protein Misp04_19080 [Micromonospora sp. NBRC 101691]|nr:hypothetical protein Misp04_19080 [Micromonospora sp. NBRC 101691]
MPGLGSGRLHPYLHQAKVFARLSTKDGSAQPTLITTGTGSGKTESFRIPVLDHCRRRKQQGRAGVEALLLYPMNALATGQTQRINELLTDPALAGVTAGLYIGDVAAIEYPHVLTKRSEMRRTPPDMLITNYKMLDLLLQRADDVPLWQDAEPAYVVLRRRVTGGGGPLRAGRVHRPASRWRRTRWRRVARCSTSRPTCGYAPSPDCCAAPPTSPCSAGTGKHRVNPTRTRRLPTSWSRTTATRACRPSTAGTAAAPAGWRCRRSRTRRNWRSTRTRFTGPASGGTSAGSARWSPQPGTRSGNAPPAFPKGVSAPAFLLAAAKSRSEFDAVTALGNWYQDWSHRCLGVDLGATGSYLSQLLPALAAGGIVATGDTEDGNRPASTGDGGRGPGRGSGAYWDGWGSSQSTFGLAPT